MGTASGSKTNSNNATQGAGGELGRTVLPTDDRQIMPVMLSDMVAEENGRWRERMTNPYESPLSVDASVTELRCPRCHTDLARSSGTRCPECNANFDAATLSRLPQFQMSSVGWPPSSARKAVGVAGISLLPFVLLSTAAIHFGRPQWWSPLPLILFIPAWISPVGGVILNGIVVLGTFARFSWPLTDGRPRIPIRSLGAISVLQILHWIYLSLVFTEGIRLNAAHTIAVCGINFVLSIAIIGVALCCWKRPNFLLAIGFQWLAWFWLAMYSFPLLSDLVGGV